MRSNVVGASVYAYTGSRAIEVGRPTVVFVHGAANDHSVWALQSRWFAHHGFNSVAVDLPGHGRSEGDPLLSIRELADWVIRLLDALGIERASLAGHSMGALTVLDAASRHPARVERLALLGASTPMSVSPALMEAAKAQSHVAYEMINAWGFAPSKQLGGNRNPGLWLLGNWMRLMERSRPGVLAIDLAACHGYADGAEAAAKVRCPTLLILGAQDQMVPAKAAKLLVDTLADVRVATIPACGHVMMAEAPDAVLDQLRGFLVAEGRPPT